jgi:hypothetical protein
MISPRRLPKLLPLGQRDGIHVVGYLWTAPGGKMPATAGLPCAARAGRAAGDRLASFANRTSVAPPPRDQQTTKAEERERTRLGDIEHFAEAVADAKFIDVN